MINRQLISEKSEDTGIPRLHISPLDKYLVSSAIEKKSTWIESDDTLDNIAENLSAINKVKSILKLAEERIKSISSTFLVKNEKKVIFLEEPSYFDDKFDHNTYIRELVNAKINGFNIVQNYTVPNICMQIFTPKNGDQNVFLNSGYDDLSDDKYGQTKIHNKYDITRHITNEHSSLILNEINMKNRKISNNTFFLEINAQKPQEIHNNVEMNRLSVHSLPGITIRSQLTERKFPVVDIQPFDEENINEKSKNNVAVVQFKFGDKVNNTVPLSNTSILQGNDFIQSIKYDEDVATELINPDKYPKEFNPDFKYSSKNMHRIVSSPLGLDKFTPSNRNFTDNSSYGELGNFRPSKKHISKLKKYGIPEIQKIYNPRSHTIKKPNVYKTQNFSKHIQINPVSTCIRQTDMKLKPNYKYAYLLNQKNESSFGLMNSNITGVSKMNTNTAEYIPYSKLTVGGMKVDDAQTYISKFKTSKTLNKDLSNASHIDQKSFVPCKEDITILNQGQKILDEGVNRLNIKNVKDSEVTTEYTNEFDISSLQQTSESSVVKSFSILSDKNIDRNQSKNNIQNSETRDIQMKSQDILISHYKETQTSPELGNNGKSNTDNEKILPMSKLPINIEEITLADMLRLEKTISSFNSQLCINREIPKITLESQDNENMKSVSMSSKNTQTALVQTTHMMTSPTKKVDKIVSPILNVLEDATSPGDLPSMRNPQQVTTKKNDIQQVKNQKNKEGNDNNSPVNKNQSKYTSSETFTDVSQSETTETFSLGEVNFKILRKKMIRVLNQSNTSSFSTSINSDIKLESTFSSKESDGEIRATYK